MSQTLPSIPRVIDNTAMSAFQRCPTLYDLSMIQGWKPKKQSSALSFGTLWHLLLETHYKTGGNKDEVYKAFAVASHKVPSEGDYRTSQRALLDYEKYRKEYDIKKDCEQTYGFPDNPMVEISTAVFSDILGHDYGVKIDRIVVENGLGYVEDHKTTSRLDKSYFRQYELSNQMMGYVRIANYLIPDIKVVGVRINLLHALTNSSAFHRHIVTYPDSRLKEWEENSGMWMRIMERAHETGIFPRHYGDNGCNGKFGRCEFFDVCSSSPLIRDEILKQDFHIEHWDPLKHQEGDPIE